MGSQIEYSSASESVSVTPVQFLNAAGTATDPASVTCVITDPTGAVTAYTYGGSGPNNTITRSATGSYALSVTGLTVSGLYMFTWIGTGSGVQQVTPGTFRLVPLTDTGTGMQFWYTGLEELKSRINRLPTGNNAASYHVDDYELQLAIQTVAGWINSYCGRHFYQITESRTFAPTDGIWEIGIDDLVSTPSVAANVAVTLDYDGDGNYDVAWTQGVEYQLKLARIGGTEDAYNINAAGVPRPYRAIQVLTGVPGQASPVGGGWFPWLWPFTYLNRVKVTGTWGWNTVPPAVQQASLMLCVDMFRTKDAFWGIGGSADTGLIKIGASPYIVELLKDYVLMKRKAGV